VRSEGIKSRSRFLGRQVLCPVDIHQSVSSVIESENVTASLEIAQTRWPGEQRNTSIQFGGSSVPYVVPFADMM
jgi:hypothetical protein